MLQQKVDQQIMESPMSVSRRSIVILPSINPSSSSGYLDCNNKHSSSSFDGTITNSSNMQIPVGRNSKNSLVSTEYYSNSNNSSANNLVLPMSALPDTTSINSSTGYTSCSFNDNSSSNSDNSINKSENNKLFSTTSPPTLKGRNNCAFDILTEYAESSSSDSAMFNESIGIKPIQTPPASFTISPKHVVKRITKISLEDNNNNGNTNGNNSGNNSNSTNNNSVNSNSEDDDDNNQDIDLIDSEFRVSEFSSSLRSESVLTPPNPFIISIFYCYLFIYIIIYLLFK